MASRIDYMIGGGGADRGALAVGWGLSDHSAVGCLVAVDVLEDVVWYQDTVNWLIMQVTVADKVEL